MCVLVWVQIHQSYTVMWGATKVKQHVNWFLSVWTVWWLCVSLQWLFNFILKKKGHVVVIIFFLIVHNTRLKIYTKLIYFNYSCFDRISSTLAKIETPLINSYELPELQELHVNFFIKLIERTSISPSCFFFFFFF